MPAGIHRLLILLHSPKGTPLDTSFARMACNHFSAHYPRRVWKILAFPCGLTTAMTWGIISMFLDQATCDMVNLMPAEGGRQPKELLDYVDEDQLLVAFGGKLPEPDGRNAEEEVLALRKEEAEASWFG
eukprot:TRINITY_DN30655_c0_g1_i1.p1 TRINITY_DN30655_c0_g1~~TRINITY_DN30655_c0_g1_i1.p1  ORF type:complete len:129 (+),score=24.82 TRINITY_DN30655_c0_g1_i1:90-476(+)